MKYEIPQYKFKSVIFKFLNNHFDSYEKVYSKKFPVGYFYVLGDKIKAEVIPTHNALMLDWSLWNEICDVFSFQYIKDVQKIVGEWADDRFGMENTLVDLNEFIEDRYDL